MDDRLDKFAELQIKFKSVNYSYAIWMPTEEGLRMTETYASITGFRNGTAFSIPSMLAKDCTIAIGIMKKKVRKKKATPMISLRTESETYGIARFCQ